MREFKVNQIYYMPGLFDNGYRSEIVDRTENTITVHNLYEDDTEVLKIVVQEDREVAECWNYKGHSGVIEAR